MFQKKKETLHFGGGFIFFIGDLLIFSAADPLRALLIAHRLSPELRLGRYTGGCSPSVSSHPGPI